MLWRRRRRRPRRRRGGGARRGGLAGPPEAAEAKAALAGRLAELEQAIEAAVEAEDYERADELNTAATGCARSWTRTVSSLSLRANGRSLKNTNAPSRHRPRHRRPAMPPVRVCRYFPGRRRAGPPPRRGPGTRPCHRASAAGPLSHRHALPAARPLPPFLRRHEEGFI